MGENHKSDDIIYLDYNSMYPAIMASMDVPTNLSDTQIHEMNDTIINIKNASR